MDLTQKKLVHNASNEPLETPLESKLSEEQANTLFLEAVMKNAKKERIL